MHLVAEIHSPGAVRDLPRTASPSQTPVTELCEMLSESCGLRLCVEVLATCRSHAARQTANKEERQEASSEGEKHFLSSSYSSFTL